MVQLEKTVKKV